GQGEWERRRWDTRLCMERATPHCRNEHPPEACACLRDEPWSLAGHIVRPPGPVHVTASPGKGLRISYRVVAEEQGGVTVVRRQIVLELVTRITWGRFAPLVRPGLARRGHERREPPPPASLRAGIDRSPDRGDRWGNPGAIAAMAIHRRRAGKRPRLAAHPGGGGGGEDARRRGLPQRARV